LFLKSSDAFRLGVVHIGMTFNLQSRLTTHKTTKDFNLFAVEKCHRFDVMLMEALYINRYRPTLNRAVFPMDVIIKMIIERIDCFDVEYK
jgi:hypothetical protein